MYIIARSDPRKTQGLKNEKEKSLLLSFAGTSAIKRANKQAISKRTKGMSTTCPCKSDTTNE